MYAVVDELSDRLCAVKVLHKLLCVIVSQVLLDGVFLSGTVNIGVARIISWSGHRFSTPLVALSSFLAPYCLNFSDEDSTPLTFFSASLCTVFNHLCT